MLFLTSIAVVPYIHIFIEPFVAGKIKCAFFPSNSKHMYMKMYCVSAETGQAARNVTNHTIRVKQTDESLKLARRIPGARSNQGYEPLKYSNTSA